MSIGFGVSQKQTTGMVPEHILGKSVLKMGLQELQEFVQTELNDNPALSLQEELSCPVCGTMLIDGQCSTCGSRLVDEIEYPDESDTDDWTEDNWTEPEPNDDFVYEPFAHVAAPSSLEAHLKEQIHAQFREDDIPVAEFIVECLDEDGYLREPLFDIASRFEMSVPQLEAVLEQLQMLDPPGVAARSLQECLLIQIRYLPADDEHHEIACRIITDCWESMSKMKLDEISRSLEISRDSVVAALHYIRKKLNPYPASMFRDPWQTMAPRREAKLAPDVIIRDSEAGLVAEVVDPISSRITVDEIYASLHAEMSRKKNGFSDKDRERVRESVQNAKSLIDALEFRKTALRTIASELLKCQLEFITKGPAYLKPMTRKQLAQQVGLHESTICRATDNKTIQLPSGEVIPFDMLFDAALPIKELVRKLAQERINGRPLSDGQIAERLQAQGVQIARRTVAKYRDELRVLPAEYRLA